MFTPQDVNIIKDELGSEGINEISHKRGVSRPTIYRFLNGHKVRTSFQIAIYSEALKIIKRERSRKKKLAMRASRILEQEPL